MLELIIIRDIDLDHILRNLKRVELKESIFHGSQSCHCSFSLENENLKEWLGGFLPNTRLIIEPKIEGCAIALNYENGKLKNAINSYGADKSFHLDLIRNVPNRIPIKRSVHIRGELYMRGRNSIDSREFIEEYLNNKSSRSDQIAYCSYQIINSDLNHYQALKSLHMLGFEIPDTEYTHYTSDALIYKQLWINSRLFCKYPTDGIVVKVNSRKLQKQLEGRSPVHRWAYAIKNI